MFASPHRGTLPVTLAAIVLSGALVSGCTEDRSADPEDGGADADVAADTDPDGSGERDTDADAATDTSLDADGSGAEDTVDGDATADVFTPPEPTDEARARAFRLYYRERVDRALVAFNRYAVFGDTTFAVAVNRAEVAREIGEDHDVYDVVVGPADNNLIGTPIRAVWHAWRHLRSENAELTFVRLLRGMLFFEQITGIPGLTSRMALPGWTLDIDGVDGTAVRTRGDAEVGSPLGVDPDLERAIIEAFFDGDEYRYRLDPLDSMLRFYPAHDPGDYAVTVSIPNLPDFIRISDCCATLFRTPEGHDWENAWWSNHNSRDNYPDIALGVVAALEAQASPDTPADVRELAADVIAAGRRITDLVESNEGNVMTIDEYHTYGDLTVSGARRPHGLPENENLGGMSSCPMALLNRSLSTEGLDAEPEDVWLPGTPEHLITPEIEAIIECPYEEPRTCTGIDDAWCGHTWESIFDLQAFGQNWLDFARNMETFEPGSSGTLLGAFQNDYDDVVEAMVTLIASLDVQERAELAADGRRTLRNMTDLMREFADIVYGTADPDRAARQRYEAAVFDALGAIEVNVDDLADFAIEEERMARLEGYLDIAASSPQALRTDDEIRTLVQARLDGLTDGPGPGRADAVRDRYAATYPDGDPPIRRAGDAYEARQGDGPWVPVPNPRHAHVGGISFMQAIVLCSTAPYLLDCSWAALGCEAPDLDDSGAVDASDTALLEDAFTTFGDGATCDGADECGGADIDRSGTLDGSDRAFMEAAQGCIR